MVAVSAPFGLRAVFHPSGQTRPVALYDGITSAYNTNIFQGQPVLLTTAGVLNPVAANNVAFQGAFDGVEFTDVQGRRRVSNFWPANTVGTEIIAYYYSDPDLVYEVQADGSLAATSVGDQANFSNFAAGSTVTGQAATTISATLAGAGNQGQVRILGRSLRADNIWGDAFTVVQVQVSRHQFVNPQTAI